MLWGLTAAASTTAAGLSINIVTDNQGSLVAWLAVAACTLLTGTATALIDRANGTSEIPLERLVIELTIGPDGSTTFTGRAEGTQAAEMLARYIPSAPPERPLPEGDGTLPKPLPVALITRSRATRIARRLAEVKRLCDGSNKLDVRLCVDNRVQVRREALRHAHVVIIDDLCTQSDGGLLIGGIDLTELSGLQAVAVMLSCHDSAGAMHTDALRRSLERPVAFLGCAGLVPAEHLEALYLPLLNGFGGLAGSLAAAEELRSAMDGALVAAQQARPQLDWNRWATKVLQPIPVPER